MDLKKARSHHNYLLTLSFRGEECFGPLALTFMKDHDLEKIGLLPDERFSLLMATAQALASEPKRYSMRLQLLEKAREILSETSFSNAALAQQLDRDTQKTNAELNIYQEAMQVARPQTMDKQRIIIQTDVPEYFLDIAQKRASTYYQEKFSLTKEAKTAQHFSGAPRKFEPDNKNIQKEFSGACAPFMNSRINAFHLMLPFDLKISRKPDDPLDAILRIFYAKMGYSFPLVFEMGKLCSAYDGQVLDISMDDPNLLFVSASQVKEPQFKNPEGIAKPELPPEYAYPVTVLERSGTLGPFLQIVSNFKAWFDPSLVSILIQGAPDLHEYGLQGGSGLMTRTHASDKIEGYAEARTYSWQEGLSYNFVNIHLTLNQGTDSAFIPFNTPLFTLYPTLSRQCFKIEDAGNLR